MSAFDNLPQSAAVRDDRISAPSQVPNPEPYTDTEKDFQPPVRVRSRSRERIRTPRDYDRDRPRERRDRSRRREREWRLYKYETSDEELDIRKTYARPVAERRHLYAGVAGSEYERIQERSIPAGRPSDTRHRRTRHRGSSSERSRSRPLSGLRKEDPKEDPKDDARSQNDRKTIVPPQPGLDGERTHQEPSSPTVAAIPVDRNWHPQQMYNPESVMPVFPTLPRIFGDVRDDSPARIQWNAKLASGIAPNEVMERITGLFGMESFKQHCLDLYERLIALPTRTRLEKAGILDLSLTGSEGCGNNLAALRYRELLVSLEIIPSSTSVHYFTDAPTSLASMYQFVRKIQSQEGNAASESYVFVYFGNSLLGSFDTLRSRIKDLVDHSKIKPGIVWVGVGISTTTITPSHYKIPIVSIHTEDLTRLECCHGLRFLLGFGDSQSVQIEGGDSGPIFESVVDHVVKGHQARGSWKQWTTLESSAKMLRDRRMRPCWTPSGVISIQGLESAGRYYGKAHLLGERPDDLTMRVSEFAQLMQLVGLYRVKQDILSLVSIEEKNQVERLGTNNTRMSRFQRASLHRYYHGPPGIGRRTVATLYGRILWRLGLVDGMRAVRLSLDSLAKLSLRAIQKQIRTAFDDPKNVGVVIFEDAGLEGVNDILSGDDNEQRGFSHSNLTSHVKRVNTRTANDDAISDEQEDYEDYHYDGDSGDNDGHVGLTQYSSRKIRSIVLGLLATIIEEQNNQDNMPVLVMVGPTPTALHSTQIRSQHIAGSTNSWANPFDEGLPTSIKKIFAQDSQIIHCQSYTTTQLWDLLLHRLEDKCGQDEVTKILCVGRSKNVLLEALSISRLRPSFDNTLFIQRLVFQFSQVEASSAAKDPIDALSKQLQEPENVFWGRVLQGLEGLNDAVKVFKNIFAFASNIRPQKDHDPRPYVPFAFVFSGPPGIGKTSLVYNVVAPVYHAIGLLDRPEVVTCSIAELTHPQAYVTRTGKTEQAAEPYRVLKARVARLAASAFGKVLHISASGRIGDYYTYRDAEELKDWQDKILSCVMECLDANNQALKSKVVFVFEEQNTLVDDYQFSKSSPHLTTIRFPVKLGPEHILRILQANLRPLGIKIQDIDIAGTPVASTASGNLMTEVATMLMALADSEGFSNGWELEALTKDIARAVFANNPIQFRIKAGGGVLALGQLASILEQRYPGKPWVQRYPKHTETGWDALPFEDSG